MSNQDVALWPYITSKGVYQCPSNKDDRITALQSFDRKSFEAIFDAQEFAHLPAVTYAGIAATAHSDERYLHARFELSSIQIILQ